MAVTFEEGRLLTLRIKPESSKGLPACPAHPVLQVGKPRPTEFVSKPSLNLRVSFRDIGLLGHHHSVSMYRSLLEISYSNYTQGHVVNDLLCNTRWVANKRLFPAAVGLIAVFSSVVDSISFSPYLIITRVQLLLTSAALLMLYLTTPRIPTRHQFQSLTCQPRRSI